MPIQKSGLALASAVIAIAIAASMHLAAEAAQPKTTPLQNVLAQMNAASTKFTSAQADLKQEIFTKVVQDTETQTGKVYFLRKGSTTDMGMTLLAPDAQPGTPPAKIVQYKDGIGQVLTTGTGQIDQAAATGKNQSIAATMMTLGFGGSGTDLQKEWTITDQGPEQINEGSRPVQTEKLDLISKDAKIRDTYSHVTIWIDPVRDVSLKQTYFVASSDDTRTMIYSNIRLNQKVDVAPFAIKCKGKCTVVNH